MTGKSNKGRFKCPHEAQAVWNFFTLEYQRVLSEFESDAQLFDMLTDTAQNLHKARLIHGSIYDEHGRIEDKDVAQAVHNAFAPGDTYDYFRSSLKAFEDCVQHMIEHREIRGTIFYE